MTVDRERAKEEVTLLHQVMRKYNPGVKRGNAFEIMAQMHGHRGWNEYSAALNESNPLSSKETFHAGDADRLGRFTSLLMRYNCPVPLSEIEAVFGEVLSLTQKSGTGAAEFLETDEQTRPDLSDLSPNQKNVRSSIENIRRLPRQYCFGEQAFLDIQSNGTVFLTTSHPDDNAVDEDIYHGRTCRIDLPDSVIPQKVAEWMEEEHVFEEILKVSGAIVLFHDQHANHRGKIDEQARMILDALNDEAAVHRPNSAFSHERGEIISQIEAAFYMEDFLEELRSCPTPEAAEAMALEYTGNGDEVEYEDGWGIVDPDEAKGQARYAWETAHVQ